MENYEEVLKELFAEAGGEVDLKRDFLTKINDKSEIIQVFGLGNVVPILYVAELDDIARGTSSRDELVKAFRPMIQGCVQEAARRITQTYYQEKDFVLKNVILMAVNTDMNRDFIEGAVSRAFHDLTLLCRVVISHDNEGLQSYVVPKTFLETLGVSEDELFERAVSNSLEKVLYRRLFSFCSIPATVEIDDLDDSDDVFIVLSYKFPFYGAGIIALTDVFKKISEKLGSDLIIIPSSVNELNVAPYPEDFDMRGMLETVERVNNDMVEKKEVLSYNMYVYRRETDSVEVVEK